MDAILIPVATVLTAIISSAVIVRGQRRQSEQHEADNNTVQIQTIFDGYSRIVSDLHAEVQRLHSVVDALHKEQEACEERNAALEQEIVGLQDRICRLEETNLGSGQSK
jgi:peptidoglycan hydrolase CwlO-like protein